MKIGDKIREIRKKYELSQKEFAEKIGISYGALQSYEYGETIPRVTILRRISSIFGVDIASLLKEGPLIFINKHSSHVEIFRNSKLDTHDVVKNIKLDFYEDISASAGYGYDNYNEKAIPIYVSSSFLEKVLGVSARAYDVIKVSGDSMEPFIKDGDSVLVQRVTEAINGDIVIANLCGNLYVKKFLLDPIRKIVKLTSLNDFYQDIVVEGYELDQLKIVGKVRARFSIDINSLKSN